MDYNSEPSAYDKLKDLYESGFILEHEFLRRKAELGITEEYSAKTTNNNDYNNNDNGQTTTYEYSNNNNNDDCFDMFGPPTISDQIQLPPPPPPQIQNSSEYKSKPINLRSEPTDGNTYKIYGGDMEDTIIVFYQSIRGNYQSSPISYQGRAFENIIQEIKDFVGLSNILLYEIDQSLPHKIPVQDSPLFGYDGSNIKVTSKLFTGREFKKGGYFLVKENVFLVHRSSWSPKISGSKDDYVRHSYNHSELFQHNLLNSTLSSDSFEDQNRYYKTTSYYEAYSHPSPTPFTKKLGFLQKVRNLQWNSKEKKPSYSRNDILSIPFSMESTHLLNLIQKSVSEFKCLLCKEPIAEYLSEKNQFLCDQHYDEKIITDYLSIDFKSEEGNAYPEGSEITKKPQSSSGEQPIEEVVENSDRFCLFDPNEIVFLKTKRSIKMAFDDYNTHKNHNNNASNNNEEGGVIQESLIPVGKFLMKQTY